MGIIDKIQQWLNIGKWRNTFGSGVPRSPQWPEVRKAHLKKEPTCQVCGGDQNLNVHHIRPFHLHPELELDDSNLITLCNGSSKTIACHIRFGHFDNFRTKFNPDIRAEAPMWNKRFKATSMALLGVGDNATTN